MIDKDDKPSQSQMQEENLAEESGIPTSEIDAAQEVPSTEDSHAGISPPELQEERQHSRAAGSLPETTPLEAQKEQQRTRSENQDYLRVLRMFGGAIPQIYVDHISVAQDMHLGPGRGMGEIIPPPERDSAEITRRELQKIQQVYERPVVYTQALQVLQQEHCVALLGKPQVGKRAMAIQLALDVRLPEAPLYELSPEENPWRQVQELPLPSGSVYIVDGLLYVQARELKPLQVRALLNMLEQRQCYLIITAQTDAVFSAGIRTFSVPLPEIATALLLEKHLDYYSSFSSTQIETVLSDSALVELLSKDISPSQVDQLAARLAQGLSSNAPVVEALHGFAEAMADTVRQWFDEVAGDVESAAFRIALAVFNGAQVSEVQRAAQALTRLLQPEVTDLDKSHATLAFTSPFTKETLSKKLERARAKLIERPTVKEYSDAALVKVVELDDESYSNLLLTYIWEFDELRPVFLEWLCDYAVDAPSDMRLRAAGALGALAGLDFDYITRRVFYRWAGIGNEDSDTRRRYYQALGNALGVLIWNDEHAEDVLGLLRAWVEHGDERHKWAAARTYAQVGLRYPREALHQWRRILESEAHVVVRLTESFGIALPHPLHMSVIDALLSLFLRAVEIPHRLRPVYEQALDGLAAWVEEDSQDRTSEQAGLPLFLWLTAIRYPIDGNSDPETWPPAMLRIVGTQPDSSYRRTLAELLRAALRNPETRPLAIEALKNWVECADCDSWLAEILTLLLQDLLQLPATTRKERDILVTRLRRWAMHPRDHSKAAEQLLLTLFGS